MQEYEQERYERLVGDLSARLRKACGHLSDDEFGALVGDIARVTMHFSEIDRRPDLWHIVGQHELSLAPLPEMPAPDA